MTLADALSARLEELMKEKEITQYRLSQLSGVAQSSIADIRLKRNKGANILLIYAISVGLGIDLTEFFNSEFFKAENITD